MGSSSGNIGVGGVYASDASKNPTHKTSVNIPQHISDEINRYGWTLRSLIEDGYRMRLAQVNNLRREALETRVTSLENTIRELLNEVAVKEGMVEGLKKPRSGKA